MLDITLLHPKVVHFTIALFAMAVLLDLLGLIIKNERFQGVAWINLIFADAAGVVTVITGLLAASNVPHAESAHQIMEIHQTLGYIVLGSIVLLLIWHILLKGKFPVKAAFLYIIIGLVGVGVMFAGAYYGGEMVYTHGVAVKALRVSEEEAGHHHAEDREAHITRETEKVEHYHQGDHDHRHIQGEEMNE